MKAIEKLPWLLLWAGLLLAAGLGLAACESDYRTGAASQSTAAPTPTWPVPPQRATGTAGQSAGSSLPPTSTPILPATATPAPATKPVGMPAGVATTANLAGGPAWPLAAPPTATPPQLAMLAQDAAVIARVRMRGSSGAQQSFIFTADVTAWLKRPANLIADQITIWIPNTSPAIMPRLIHDERVDDWLVFLAPRRYDARHDLPAYDLVDPAGAFGLQDDKIVAASLPDYVGRSRAQLTAAIAQQVPTPVPIAQSVHDLSILGQKAMLIAEVQWPPTAPLVVTRAAGRRYLLNAPVVSWLKAAGPPDPEFLGLALTPEEYDRLSHGSGRYILFLSQGDSEYSCISDLLPAYHALVDGTGGIFDLAGDRIGVAGIPAYTNVAVPGFKQTLLAGIPTPGPLPSDGTPFSLAQEVSFVPYIVEADLSSEGTPGAYQSRLDTFQVRKWLKGGSASRPQTLTVDRADVVDCRYLLGKGPYILFLRDHKLRYQETPQPGLYDPFAIFAIRSGTIAFGSLSLYWGWPVERFAAAIRAVP